MIHFELKDTTKQTTKRLIISSDADGINTFGFKAEKQELYELYVLLRELFDGTANDNN